MSNFNYTGSRFAGVVQRAQASEGLSGRPRITEQIAQQILNSNDSEQNIANLNEQRISCRDISVLEDIENTEVSDSPEEQVTTPVTRGEGFLAGIKIGKNPKRESSPETVSLDTTGFFNNVNRPPRPPPSTTERPPTDPITDLLIDYGESGLDAGFNQNLLNITGSSISGLGKYKTLTYIKNYGGKTLNLNNSFPLQSPTIDDYVKYFNCSFYSLESDNRFTFFRENNNKNLITIKNIAYSGEPSVETDYQIQEDYIFKFDSYLYESSRNIRDFKPSFLFGGETSISLENQTTNTFNLKKLVDPNKKLMDHTFLFQLPFENNELLNNLNIIGAQVIDVKSNYNFYIKEYEKIASKQNESSKESTLPNLYILTKVSEKENKESTLKSFVNLNNSIKNGSKFILSPTNKFLDVKNINKRELNKVYSKYFDSFGNYYDKLTSNTKLMSDYQKRNRNIIFLSDYTKELNNISEKKYMFPMNIEFSIPTDKTTNLTKILYDSGLIDNFMIKLYEAKKQAKFQSDEFAISEQLIEQNIVENKLSNSQESTVKNTFSSKRKIINSYATKDIVNDILNTSTNSSEYVVIGDAQRILKNSSNNLFINNLRKVIFDGKLNTFIKLNNRSYADILAGKMCYNETVAYRIEKYLSNSEQPIQDYWIPNNPDLDYLKIIDSQIKYSQEYKYKIYAYQFVLGNEYSQNIPTTIGTSTEFNLRILQSPEPRIFEVELLTVNRKVNDSPPLSPEIQFVPYKGIDNKLGLFLNSRIGTEKLEVINILESDDAITSLYEKELNNLVTYNADDVAKKFEIMKLESPPIDYKDFKSGYIKIAETDIDINSEQQAAAASYIDSIEPNKKYYYCFRAIDVHNNLSNPSHIYEVEMINENGMIFPVIKNYEFKKPIYDTSIDMRRFIKIKPAYQHTLLDKEVSGISDSKTADEAIQKAKLGMTDIAVPWDKTFKIVVTSKKTGKKSEIKFKFKYILE